MVQQLYNMILSKKYYILKAANLRGCCETGGWGMLARSFSRKASLAYT